MIMKPKSKKPQQEDSDTAPSLAIAFNAQKMTKKKSKPMAMGGEMTKSAEDNMSPPLPSRKEADEKLPEDETMDDSFAKGGEVHPADLMDDDERAESIADYIMRKRKSKAMAEGGQVDLGENSEEHGNFEDDLSLEALGKEQYDDTQLSPQPSNSNEHTDSIDSDRRDMVGRIKAKLSKRS